MDLKKLEELISDRLSLKCLGLERGYYHMETGHYLGYHDDYKGEGSITEEELDDISYFLDFPSDILEASLQDPVNMVSGHGLTDQALEYIYRKITQHDLLERQNIARRFCDEHIKLSVSAFVEKILELDQEAAAEDYEELFGIDYFSMFKDCDWEFDEEDLTLYTDEGEVYKEYESVKDFIEDLPSTSEDWDGGDVYLCYYEPLEYYAVSDFLANKLKERGEPVTQFGYHWVWGRCCSGQAIYLDSVIEDIAVECYKN